MAFNITASLDKLTCTNFVNFGKCQDRFGQLSWSKKDSKSLDIKLNVFKKQDNKEFRLAQKFINWGADFNQFMRLRNQLVIPAEHFAGEENFSPVVIAALSKDMDEQFKLAQKVVEVVDWANKKICVALLRHSVLKPDNSSDQLRCFAGKKEVMQNEIKILEFFQGVTNFQSKQLFKNVPF